MRLRRGANDSDVPAGQAPGDAGSLSLINIAFLLLAFFVMAGAIRAADPFTVSPPPGAAPALDRAEGPELLIGADGRMALDGVPLPDGEAEGAALDRALRALVGSASPARRGHIRLRADGRADAGRLMQVLGRLRAAGLSDVTLVTVPPAPAGRP